jgi:hypothetical protein
MSNEQTDNVLWSSVNSEQLEQCRKIQDQMSLNSIQMEKLVILIAVLDKEQKEVMMQQLLY